MPENAISKNQTSEDLEVKKEMEKMVDTYDDYMMKTTHGREKILREMTVGLAPVKPGDYVLEIGCATGSLTLEAQKKAGPSGKAHGIDIIPGMVEKSREKAERENLKAEFRLASMDAIPYQDNYFNVVLCSFMIFHMSDKVRKKGFEEIYRVLKPGGTLVILDLALPKNPVPRFFVKLLLGFMFNHDLKELIPLMETAEFKQIEMDHAKFRFYGLSILSYVRGMKKDK